MYRSSYQKIRNVDSHYRRVFGRNPPLAEHGENGLRQAGDIHITIGPNNDMTLAVLYGDGEGNYQWRVAVRGTRHPSLPGYMLSNKNPLTPSWVTEMTYRRYFGQRPRTFWYGYMTLARFRPGSIIMSLVVLAWLSLLFDALPPSCVE